MLLEDKVKDIGSSMVMCGANCLSVDNSPNGKTPPRCLYFRGDFQDDLEKIQKEIKSDIQQNIENLVKKRDAKKIDKLKSLKNKDYSSELIKALEKVKLTQDNSKKLRGDIIKDIKNWFLSEKSHEFNYNGVIIIGQNPGFNKEKESEFYQSDAYQGANGNERFTLQNDFFEKHLLTKEPFYININLFLSKIIGSFNKPIIYTEAVHCQSKSDAKKIDIETYATCMNKHLFQILNEQEIKNWLLIIVHKDSSDYIQIHAPTLKKIVIPHPSGQHTHYKLKKIIQNDLKLAEIQNFLKEKKKTYIKINP